jgi:hypothetical protein
MREARVSMFATGMEGPGYGINIASHQREYIVRSRLVCISHMSRFLQSMKVRLQGGLFPLQVSVKYRIRHAPGGRTLQ